MEHHPHQHSMRRKDRELKDTAEILQIVRDNNAAVISMVDNGMPYGIMMNYAPVIDRNQGLTLVFHGALKGRKIDCFRQNPNVSIFINDAKSMKVDTSDPNPAEWTTYYRSAVLRGTVTLLETIPQKKQAIAEFLAHFTSRTCDIPEPALRATALFYVHVTDMSGKAHTPPRGED